MEQQADKREDDFRGSTDLLLRSIDAFLDLTDEQAFVPHNLSKSSHAYRLLVAARVRLEASIRSEAKTAVKLVNTIAGNSHEALVSVLRDMFENPQFQVAIGGNPIMVEQLMERARAALALAAQQP